SFFLLAYFAFFLFPSFGNSGVPLGPISFRCGRFFLLAADTARSPVACIDVRSFHWSSARPRPIPSPFPLFFSQRIPLSSSQTFANASPPL
ncbi:hypothetical protein B0H16DRAFT_1603828, partial [Mycena metata]